MSVGNALTGWQGTRGRAMTNGPLDRLRVIEAGTFFSAPFAGMMLSDLGADVIKVEPPDKGDVFDRSRNRRKAFRLMFINLNGGTNSVIVDLKEPEGQRALVASCETQMCSSIIGDRE